MTNLRLIPCNNNNNSVITGFYNFSIEFHLSLNSLLFTFKFIIIYRGKYGFQCSRPWSFTYRQLNFTAPPPPHINKMVASARKVASWVLGVFRDRSKVVMLQLYKSLIRSKLEYCSPLWNPSIVRDIEKIEDVQRFFTNRISGIRNV